MSPCVSSNKQNVVLCLFWKCNHNYQFTQLFTTGPVERMGTWGPFFGRLVNSRLFPILRFFSKFKDPLPSSETFVTATDNGHPERPFFQNFESFGLRQTNWAEILGCILVISSQTIGTILELWVPWCFSYKKCWLLSLKHITPKYPQNKILAVNNLEKSLRTSVFGGYSCDKITTTWIQIFRQNWNEIFSNASHQIMI